MSIPVDQPTKMPTTKMTASALAGTGMTLFWELVQQFSGDEWRPTLVAASVLFVSAAAGYFVRERV